MQRIVTSDLLFLELAIPIDKSKAQISDFLSFREGWWRPSILSFSRTNLFDKDILRWIETRKQNADIDILSENESLTTRQGRLSTLLSPETNIMYIKPHYSPKKLVDELWITLGDLIRNNPELKIHLTADDREISQPIGFIANQRLMVFDKIKSINDLIIAGLKCDSLTKKISAFPDFLNN